MPIVKLPRVPAIAVPPLSPSCECSLKNSLLLLVTGTGGTLREAGLIVTVPVTTSAPVVTVKVRPVPNSASTERTVDTITLTTSNIAGDVVRNVKLGANVQVNPGEEIEIELTTKGGGNGKCVPYVIFEPAYVGNLEVGKSVSKPYSDSANAVGKIYNVQA